MRPASQITAAVLLPAVLAGCLAAPPATFRVGERDLTASVLPMEEQMYGGAEAYIDENGEQQVVYWDALRTIIPVAVSAADSGIVDEATARAAADLACRAQGYGGVDPDATALRIEEAAGEVTSWRIEGCLLPEGGA